MKKYKLQFVGYGVEVIVGTTTKKMYDHFKENGLDVGLHMNGEMEDELSEDIHEGVTEDTKYENDRLYHNCGAYLNSNTEVILLNEKDETVTNFSLEYKVGDKWDSECEQEIIFKDFNEEYIIVGQEYSKGLQAEFILNLEDDEEFDQSKLVILYEDIDEEFDLITGVRYKDVDLECTGELSSKGKGSAWYIQEVETGEQTDW